MLTLFTLKSLEISTSNQKSYTNEGQIIQWPKGKGQTVKQWSTKHYPITNQRESHWMSRVNARVPDGLSVPDPMVWLVKLRLSDTNINVLETSLRKIQITYIKHKCMQHKNERRQSGNRKSWRTSQDGTEDVRTCKWANWTTYTPLNSID